MPQIKDALMVDADSTPQDNLMRMVEEHLDALQVVTDAEGDSK